MATTERRKLRLPLTVLAFLVVFGLVAALNTAYLAGRALLENAVRRATATEGTLAVSLAGEALLLRREVVLVAPTAGIWQAATEAGQRVSAGAKIGEILDPSLLARAQAAQEEIKAGRAAWEGNLTARRNRVEAELHDVTAEIERTLAGIRAGLESAGNAVETRRLEEELRKLVARREALLVEQARLSAEAESGGPWHDKSREAERLFRAASTTVAAPVAGAVFFTMDGWEEAFDPLQAEAGLTLEGAKGPVLTAPVAAGARVAAWQILAKVVQDERTFLRLTTKAPQAMLTIGDRVEVSFPAFSTQVAARVAALAQDKPETITLLLELGSSPPALAAERRAGVEVVARRAHGILVPEAALVQEGAQTGVYVYKGGRWQFQGVEVLVRQDGKALVAGLEAGDEVAVGRRP